MLSNAQARPRVRAPCYFWLRVHVTMLAGAHLTPFVAEIITLSPEARVSTLIVTPRGSLQFCLRILQAPVSHHATSGQSPSISSTT